MNVEDLTVVEETAVAGPPAGIVTKRAMKEDNTEAITPVLAKRSALPKRKATKKAKVEKAKAKVAKEPKAKKEPKVPAFEPGPRTGKLRKLNAKDLPSGKLERNVALTEDEAYATLIGGTECYDVIDELHDRWGTWEFIATIPWAELTRVKNIGRQAAVRLEAMLKLRYS